MDAILLVIVCQLFLKFKILFQNFDAVGQETFRLLKTDLLNFGSKILSNQNHQFTVVSNCGKKKKSSILCIVDLSVQTRTQRY